MSAITPLIIFILEVLKWLVLARVLISWLPMLGIHLPPHHSAVQFLYRVTNPILRPLQPYGRVGGIDLSPIIAFFLISLVQNILRGASIAQVIAFAIVLVIAFSVHEFAHAFVAYQLGDPTAKNQGRLTLDPRQHLDVLGSLMVLAFGFGWAKPVPVSPNYLRNGPKTGMAIVAAAGPLSNLILAAFATVVIRFSPIEVTPFIISRFFPTLGELMFAFIWLNVILFFFNLIPIPPLDGFKVLLGFLPYETAASLRKLESVGPLILLFLFLFGGGVFTTLIGTPTSFVVRLLIG